MRIENKEYIKKEIEILLYYYILKDYKNLKIFIDNEKIKEDIYNSFIDNLEDKYKIKIEDINNFKEDYIYYEINNILGDIIESKIY